MKPIDWDDRYSDEEFVYGTEPNAFLAEHALSAGYALASQADRITLPRTGAAGSIGVIMSTWNYRGLMNKVGVRPLTFKSGKFKDMLSGTREPDDIPAEERAMVQALIDETYEKFKGVVMKGERPRSRTTKSRRPKAGRWSRTGVITPMAAS